MFINNYYFQFNDLHFLVEGIYHNETELIHIHIHRLNTEHIHRLNTYRQESKLFDGEICDELQCDQKETDKWNAYDNITTKVSFLQAVPKKW